MSPVAAPVPRPEGLHAPFAQFFDAAVADGWEHWPPAGPWGVQDRAAGIDPRTGQLHQTGERLAGDSTVVLRRDDAIIWLVDRVITPPWSPALAKVDRWTRGWFADGLHSFDVPQAYDAEAIEALRTRCHGCGQASQELVPVHFTGRYCPDCAPSAKARLETPGWCD